MISKLGERIELLKEESGLTYRAFANVVGIPYETIYSYVKRDIDARAYTLIALSKAFDVSVDWLLGLTEERKIFKGEST